MIGLSQHRTTARLAGFAAALALLLAACGEPASEGGDQQGTTPPAAPAQ